MYIASASSPLTACSRPTGSSVPAMRRVRACHRPSSGENGVMGESEPPPTRTPPSSQLRTGVAVDIITVPKRFTSSGPKVYCIEHCVATTTPRRAAVRMFFASGHR